MCLTSDGCSHVSSLNTTQDGGGAKSCHSCGRVSCGQECGCCCGIAGSQTNVDGVLAWQSQRLGRQHTVQLTKRHSRTWERHNKFDFLGRIMEEE